jgi:uncharacterized protein
MKNTFIFLLAGFLLIAIIPSYSQDYQFRVLLYTMPDKWHDQALPTAVNEFQKMADLNFFSLTWTQQDTVFNEEFLKDFAVVIFLNATPKTFTDAEYSSFKKFIENGGGFVGIHATGVTASSDIWFQKLVGRSFYAHPDKQTAVLTVNDKNFPATMQLPDKIIWTDEWYEFGDALTANQHVLLTVDESTYDVHRVGTKRAKYGMGDFHPICWYQDYDGGRSFYIAMGHMGISYNDPWFLKLIYGGIYWAATGKGILH